MKQDSSAPTKVGRPRDFDEDKALHQAMLLFWRHGFETTSMSQLAKTMNMNAPSIYAAFGEKKSLFLKALELYVGKMEDLEKSLNEAPTAFAAIEDVLRQSAFRFTGKDTPNGCMLASAAATGSIEAVDVQVRAGKIRAKIETLMKNRIERDIKDQILPKTTSAEALAALAIATIQGMSVLARDGAPRKKILLIAETAMACWN